MSRFKDRPFGRGKFLVTASIVAQLAATGTAIPQETQLLQRVQVVGGTAGTCPAIFIGFDETLMYQSLTFSPDRRNVSVVLARDLVGEGPEAGAGLIETFPDQTVPGRGLVSISLDGNRTSPILTLRFVEPVDLSASQAGESSIVLLNIRSSGATDCGAPAVAPNVADAGPEADGPVDEIERDFEASRQAIVAGNYPQAIRLLGRLLSQPEHERIEEAQELLGLARERNGQLAQAQAEYETYLAQYPNSSGAPRVRQRLAGVMTAQAQPRAPERVEDGAEGPVLAGLPEQELPPVRTRRRLPSQQPLPEEEPEPAYRGFVSSYYYRSQGSTVFTEFDTGTTNTDDEIYSDSLVTSLDLEGKFETEVFENTWRIAGESELDFGDEDHTLSPSRAYIDMRVKSNDMHIRLGRQSQNNGGVQGRFDGVEITLPPIGSNTIAAVFGSPVESIKDGVYENEKLLFGLRATREDITPGLDATIYSVHQVREGYTDRQAVGFEAQYQKNATSVVGIIDYDTYFDTVSFARISGTWLRPDQSSFSITADHVNSPALSFSNALTGQAVTTLSELSASFSTAEMKQLALDRTPETDSLTLAYSRPFTDHWQFSVDGSVYRTSAAPASGGVAAQPAPGTEYFGSLQFVGANIFSESDTVSFAFRYADASTSDLLLLDTYRRSNAGGKARWKPRLQVGYRRFTDGSTEKFAIPSANMTYKMNKDTDFEFEIGGRISDRDAPSFTEEANEVFLTAGINRQF